ncbi:hypothetical protein KKB84_02470 [bacterium]|nr:hypothetical protein [bacterium]
MIAYLTQFLEKINRRLINRNAGNSSILSLCYFYWRDKTRIRELLRNENNSLVSVWDFHASPYALGDILTWNMRLCVEAISRGKTAVDICILADQTTPNNRNQGCINSFNYQKFLLEILPVFFVNPFFVNPMGRNIYLYAKREHLESYYIKKLLCQHAISPDISGYTSDYIKSLANYASHDIINNFYFKNGYIPLLSPPKGLDIWAENFLKSYNPGKFFVCVHIRQRRRDSTNKRRYE